MKYGCYFRAEYTKYVVTPAIGLSGVGSAMAAYGAFDGIVSIMRIQNCSSILLVLVQFGYLDATFVCPLPCAGNHHLFLIQATTFYTFLYNLFGCRGLKETVTLSLYNVVFGI